MSLYLVAEIGINHNGDLELAKRMVSAAAGAGFNAVKFQKRTINAVYTQEFLDGPRESPWGTTQRDQKEGLEFNRGEYEAIVGYCADLGIDWSASAWDVEAQLFIREFDPPFNKVASAMLGHRPLLNEIASEGRHTLISTGMASIEEIDEVVNLFRDAKCPFELLHCISTYPMPDKDANLLCIPMLRERYRCDVGYSGHESSGHKVCVAAVALGATTLERHITLDRAMYGSDQAASLETPSLQSFASAVRAIPEALGTGTKAITDAEKAVREKLRVDIVV